MQLLAPLVLLLVLPTPSNTFLITGLDLSYGEDEGALTAAHPSLGFGTSEIGETFTVTRAYRMTTVTFSVFRKGEPNVNLVAVLYHTAYGVPSGEPIARSLPLNASTVISCGHECSIQSDRRVYAVNFTFPSAPLLLPSGDYGVALRAEGPGTIGGESDVSISSGGEDRYPGNPFGFAEGEYQKFGNDFVFEIYGKVPSDMRAVESIPVGE